MTEKTLILVKPDGVERGLIGEILRRFETKGYVIEGLKMLQPTEELLAQHYAEHAGNLSIVPSWISWFLVPWSPLFSAEIV